MDNKTYRCVVNEEGYYITVVQLDPNSDIEFYLLKKGESLVEASLPLGHVKPQWNGKEWIETATPEEIEAAKPEFLPPAPPTQEQIALAEMSMVLAMQQAENQQLQQAVAELSMLVATGGN